MPSPKRLKTKQNKTLKKKEKQKHKEPKKSSVKRAQLLAVVPCPETYFNLEEIFRQIGIDAYEFNLENGDHCADDRQELSLRQTIRN